MADRLKSSEGAKVAILMNDMSELQNDIDRIDELVETCKKFTSDNDMYGFLDNYKKIQQNIEYLMSKTFKTNIDV